MVTHGLTHMPSLSEWPGAAHWSCFTTVEVPHVTFVTAWTLKGWGGAPKTSEQHKPLVSLQPVGSMASSTNYDNAYKAHISYNHKQQRRELHSGVNQTPREKNTVTPEDGRRKAGQEHQEPPAH